MDTGSHPRVVVGVDQSIAGYAALRAAVAHARAGGLPLYAIRAGAGLAIPEESYIRAAFDTALGGIPADLDVYLETSFQFVAGALAHCASDPRDLIVVGNGGGGSVCAFFHGSTGRALFHYARCRILVVPAPEMRRSTRRSARKLHGRRADVWDRFESEVPQLRGRPFQGI